MHSRDVRFNEDEFSENREAAPKDADADSEVRRVTLELSSEANTDLGSPNMPDDPAPQLELQQSTRQRRPPDYYGKLWSHLSFQSEPTSFEEANCLSL